jgi:hypothetical protein
MVVQHVVFPLLDQGIGFSNSVISIFTHGVWGLLQEFIPVILLSYRIKKLEVFGFKLLSHGGSLNTPARFSVKYM